MAAADRKRPAPGGSSPAAPAGRKRPAPDGPCPTAAAAAAAAPPNKRARYQFGSIDRYEKLEVLGKGTYGVVFKARDRRTGETVAVKWIRGAPPDLDLRAVVREAGCLAACRGHPSVLQIRDVAADGATGHLFIVTEYVAGSRSLRDWLTRPCPEARARALMAQLLGAASRLHGGGGDRRLRTIHRDIKPENILVVPGGALKLCDFGCATPARPAGGPYPERLAGTVQYCAPEQLRGDRCYGTVVDMWALGCVMAELLTGQPLFDADTEEGVLAQMEDLRDEFAAVGLGVFDGLPELSLAGREVLAGLLSFDPEERLTADDALKHRWFTETEDGDKPPAKHPGFVPLFSAA